MDEQFEFPQDFLIELVNWLPSGLQEFRGTFWDVGEAVTMSDENSDLSSLLRDFSAKFTSLTKLSTFIPKFDINSQSDLIRMEVCSLFSCFSHVYM